MGCWTLSIVSFFIKHAINYDVSEADPIFGTLCSIVLFRNPETTNRCYIAENCNLHVLLIDLFTEFNRKDICKQLRVNYLWQFRCVPRNETLFIDCMHTYTFDVVDIWSKTRGILIIRRTIKGKVKISLLQGIEAHRWQEVKAPTLLRKTANRWRQGCQP
jgi:hypothetical protein